MKITFVYPDFMKGGEGRYYEGIASLSAALKQDGHSVGLMHLTKEVSAQEFVRIFERDFSGTHLLGFSCTTNMFSYASNYARELRKNGKVLTIFGGVHPTFCPEEALAVDGIDMACRGEGELALRELCARLEKNEPIDSIQSIWVKVDGQIKENPVRPLLMDLDALPLPDRDIFDYRNSVDHFLHRLVFMASRGCPFNCSYCCNNLLSEVYSSGRASYLRFKSVGRVMEEIKTALKKWPEVKEVYFHDDILPLRKDWFSDFAGRYKKEVGLPYICNARVELLNPEVISLLKASGCIGVKIGVESGNEVIRRDVLKRNQAQGLFLNSGALSRKMGLRLYTFNMVGIPGEDLKSALDTVKLNARLSPEEVQVTIFYPYPKTELYELCKVKGFLTQKSLAGYGEGESILSMKDFAHDDIVYAFNSFRHFMGLYKLAYALPQALGKAFENMLDDMWLNSKKFFLKRYFLFLLEDCLEFMRKLNSFLKRKFSANG